MKERGSHHSSTREGYRFFPMAKPSTVYPSSPPSPPNAAGVYPVDVTPRRTSILLCIFLTTFCIIIPACIITITIVICDRNRHLNPNIWFDSASFTSLDKSIDPKLTAKLNVTFVVTNPNKKYNISYEVIVVTLDYGGGCKDSHNFCPGLLASTRFSNFLQLTRSENTLSFQINVVDQIVGNSIIADRVRGSIEFGLKLYARINCESHIMEFYCKCLSFIFKSSNDTFASGTCMSHPSLTF